MKNINEVCVTSPDYQEGVKVKPISFEQSQYSKIESLKLKLHADIQEANSPLLIYQKDSKSISEAVRLLCCVQKDAFRLNHALIELRQFRKSGYEAPTPQTSGTRTERA